MKLQKKKKKSKEYIWYSEFRDEMYVERGGPNIWTIDHSGDFIPGYTLLNLPYIRRESKLKPFLLTEGHKMPDRIFDFFLIGVL